jgi:membrane-anchored glycerophosphoryl diester phosphodiesterase (GDPDase)
MKQNKKPCIALRVIYIFLSVVILLGIIFAAGATLGWDLIIKLEKAIVKEYYDFDIVVWSYWFVGVSTVVLVATLLIEDNVLAKKQAKLEKRKYKF